MTGTLTGRMPKRRIAASGEVAPRLLGAAYLIVILTSLIGGPLFTSAAGSGSISDVLVGVSRNAGLVRISILLDFATSVGVVALATLLYTVLSPRKGIAALLALGLWLGEAFSLAISKVGTFALVALGQEFVNAGAPAQSYYQTLGSFLYYGVHRQLGSTTHMLFYCLGGILWYYLFYQSRYIPRAISLFGLVAVCVGLVGIVLEFLGYTMPIFVYLPILPFELAIGLWLLLRGIDGARMAAQRPGAPGAAS